MSKLFWLLFGVEMTAIVVMFVKSLDSPSESGGREMAQFFFMFLPAVVLVAAALLFGFSTSRTARGAALFVALVPVVAILYFQGRDVLWRHQFDRLTAGQFQDANQQELAKAILSDNALKVQRLAKQTKLNEPSGADGLTLLNLALRENKPGVTQIVAALLDAGADPNRSSEAGWAQPLSRAISTNHSEVITLLLDHGANPNAVSASGEPVFFAPLSDYYGDGPKYLVQLLDRGADPNAVDKEGRTALMLAAIFGNASAINILLDRGADKTRKDNKSKTAFDYVTTTLSEYSTTHTAELTTAAERLRPGR